MMGYVFLLLVTSSALFWAEADSTIDRVNYILTVIFLLYAPFLILTYKSRATSGLGSFIVRVILIIVSLMAWVFALVWLNLLFG